MGVPFIPLTVKSSFSLLEGMLPVKKLAKAAAAAGYPAMGLTELGNLFSAAEASKHLAAAGVQPILGCELPVLGLPQEGVLGRETIGFLTLLVQNEAGWRNLATLVSESQQRKLTHGDAAVALPRVLELHHGLLVMTGAYGRGWAALGERQGRLGDFLEPLRQTFADRCYLQLERHGWPSGTPQQAEEHQLEAALRAYAVAHTLPLVASNDTRFGQPEDLEAFEVLVAIGDSTTLNDPHRRRFTPQHALPKPAAIAARFADLPEALANSVAIAKRCAFLLPQVSVKQMYMPKWEFGWEGDDQLPPDPAMPVDQVIRRMAESGLKRRLEQVVYPGLADEAARAAAKEKYFAQLDYELGIINRMGFDGYFLITSDFIRWAKGQGIPVGPGRGSGAGSVVAWALSITDLDPIRWELYFERFLNPERVSLPDFDVDFCQDRRDEVIAYVRRRYGAERVAHIITFGTLKAKACLRDVGRVLGLGYSWVGQVAGLIPDGANPPPIAEVLKEDERLQARYEAEDDVKRLVDTALKLEGCYRHASTHAAGVIIADRPIHEVCGLYVDPRSPMPVTQFAMGDAEYAGLVKFDFLGLKTLSIIRAAETMVKQRHDPQFDIASVPLDDEPTYAMLQRGETLGVFQIEGAGMTDLCKKMGADSLESLSAMISLYRPGPMDLIPQYLLVRSGKAAPDYPHPLLEETLRISYGIAIYQEQVMQMARILAGYTLGAADMLRRAMGKKKPEEMAKEKQKFIAGAWEHHQIDEANATRIFGLMETFAGYGFNKAHSMAYALIAYHTAYLKAHYPAEFMAATMTYDRGNQEKIAKSRSDLAPLKIQLLPPDVNRSGVFFTVEEGHIRHALSALKGAGEEAMSQLVHERTTKGPYQDIWDALARLGPQVLNKRQLDVLIKAGAFDALEPNRAWLFANLEPLSAYAVAAADAASSGQASLFGGADGPPDPAPYLASCKATPPWPALEQLQYEAEAVGFYLSAHPLEAFAAELAKLPGLKPLAELEAFAHNGGGTCKVAALVHAVREIKTKSGNRMAALTVSDTSAQSELVLFPEAYTNFGTLVSNLNTPLLFSLKVSFEGDRLRQVVEGVKPLESLVADRRELLIEVENPAAMPQLQSLLQGAAQGPTTIMLKLPSSMGAATVRLPQQLRLSSPLLANLRGVQGVRL
ncbi:MAG: DNA polymerase III subunit alpha [Alphaproteobacteria bacterium]|nr:DNA polymerase III subunit alpha [Alphaproteobacteria bacterium]